MAEATVCRGVSLTGLLEHMDRLQSLIEAAQAEASVASHDNTRRWVELPDSAQLRDRKRWIFTSLRSPCRAANQGDEGPLPRDLLSAD
jgi:hypothetical protein